LATGAQSPVIVTPAAYTAGKDFTGLRTVLSDLTQFELER